jgi:hypothetical protein
LFRTVQIIFGVLGLLLAFGADRLSMPVLLYGGIVCFGFMALAIGSEAIATREIVVGSRRRGTRQTYTGVPAVLQGIQFNLLGLFLIWLSAFLYLKGEVSGREIFLDFVRRPGIPLVVMGVLLLMQAVSMSWGSLETRGDKGWLAVVSFLFSRLLPRLILTLLGIGALGLGLFEIAAPTAFDEMGGGFLEMLYGLR